MKLLPSMLYQGSRIVPKRGKLNIENTHSRKLSNDECASITLAESEAKRTPRILRYDTAHDIIDMIYISCSAGSGQIQ